MTTPKVASTPKMALTIRNWIAGITLALLIVGSAGAAYMKVSERVTRLEEGAEIWVRVEAAVNRLQEISILGRVERAEMKVAIIELKAEILELQKEVRQNGAGGF